MSEHWKSTPKYWCKHCSCYVRDTKLERQNHDATGRHQGALKRFLRDLHRGHEREERDKERAKREINRLNGVVSGSASSSGSVPGQQSGQQGRPAAPSEAQLKKQREQLAELGVAIPSEVRPDMAMPGEWTVTNTRVIQPATEETAEAKMEATAIGVRKREVTEEEKEHEEAVRGLFKKPRTWGRASRTMPVDDDGELDALLSGTIVPRKRSSDNGPGVAMGEGQTGVKDGIKEEEKEGVKNEPDDASQGLTRDVKAEMTESEPPAKTEDGDDGMSAAPVVFKKRKSKGIRQK